MQKNVYNIGGDDSIRYFLLIPSSWKSIKRLLIIYYFPQLFQRCLMKVLYIELWKLYVAYVKETKSLLPTYKWVAK